MLAPTPSICKILIVPRHAPVTFYLPRWYRYSEHRDVEWDFLITDWTTIRRLAENSEGRGAESREKTITLNCTRWSHVTMGHVSLDLCWITARALGTLAANVQENCDTILFQSWKRSLIIDLAGRWKKNCVSRSNDREPMIYRSREVPRTALHCACARRDRAHAPDLFAAVSEKIFLRRLGAIVQGNRDTIF